MAVKLKTLNNLARRVGFLLCGEMPLNEKMQKRLSNSLGYLLHLSKNQGSQGVKLWKQQSDEMVRWIVKSELPKEYRIPSHLLWAKCSRKGEGERLFAMTVLQFHRYFIGGHSRDISSITRPSSQPGFRIDLTECSGSLWLKGIVQSTTWKRPHHFPIMVSDRSGPNGRPGWCFAATDQYAIRKFGLEQTLIEFVRATNTGKDYAWAKNFQDLWERVDREDIRDVEVSGMPREGDFCISRLARLGDKSGKTRTIAIGDMWSQMALYPLHKWMFAVLRKIPMDGTFDQDSARLKVQEWSLQRRKLFSYDLTAATDRLPAKFQASILRQLGFLDPAAKKLWLELLTSRPFLYEYKDKRGRKVSKLVRYAVGQPMGLYTSWAALAITHHVIVQWAATLAGVTPKPCGETSFYFEDYRILGDDVVIADEAVAMKYKHIMYKLGVDISLSKSWIGHGIAEFAKSLYVNGKLVSSLPVGPLALRRKYWLSDVGLLIEACLDRGVDLPISQLYKSFKPSEKQYKDFFLLLTNPLSVNWARANPLFRFDQEWWRWNVSFSSDWNRVIGQAKSVYSNLRGPIWKKPSLLAKYPASPLSNYLWEVSQEYPDYLEFATRESLREYQPYYGVGEKFVYWSAGLHDLGVCPGNEVHATLLSEEELRGKDQEERLIRTHFPVLKGLLKLASPWGEISYTALAYTLLGEILTRDKWRLSPSLVKLKVVRPKKWTDIYVSYSRTINEKGLDPQFPLEELLEWYQW